MIDRLNSAEFEKFVFILFNKKDKRDIITKSLFYLISDECRRNDHNYCNDINKIIANIILQRKNSNNANFVNPNDSNSDISTSLDLATIQIEPKRVLSPSPTPSSSPSSNTLTSSSSVSFNELPQPMISECASYLHFSELPSFLYCSRHIYISCKIIPTTIISLDEKEWFRQYINNYGEAGINYQLHRLSQYRMLQYISLHSINPIVQIQTIWKWNSLHTIHIHNPTWTYSINQVQSDFFSNIYIAISYKSIYL